MYKFIVVMLLVFCTLTGCRKEEKIVPKEASPSRQITIGLLPEQNIFRQMERYQPLADYLSLKSGFKILLKVLPAYANIVDNFTSSGVDGAFLGSFTYVLAHVRYGVEVLVRPEDLDGKSTYHGLIFVRKDSGIKSAADMKGKRFAFVDKGTTAGYLLPLEYFRSAGVMDYRTYLKEVYFTGTHEDAILDVLNRKADIGAAKNTIFEKMESSDKRIRDELTILARSPDVPENGLAVRKDLDPSIKQSLQQILLSMDKTQEGMEVLKKFGAKRFIETKDKDYEPVYQYARQSNLDLKTFDISYR